MEEEMSESSGSLSVITPVSSCGLISMDLIDDDNLATAQCSSLATVNSHLTGRIWNDFSDHKPAVLPDSLYSDSARVDRKKIDERSPLLKQTDEAACSRCKYSGCNCGWEPETPPSGRSSSSSSVHRNSGAKYKLVRGGEISVCRLSHSRTLFSKMLSSKYLRRWENHRLVLDDDHIFSKQHTGFMEHSVPYAQIEEIEIVSRWDREDKYCIRIVIPGGSLLLQTISAHMRDQWWHSLRWHRSFFKYRKILMNSNRPEVAVQEIKSMVELVATTPLQDEAVSQATLDVISSYLPKLMISNQINIPMAEDIIATIAPLLENNHPSENIAQFYARFCRECPRSDILIDRMMPVVRRILKHNMDFANVGQRTFIEEYFLAINSHNDGLSTIMEFVRSLHGPTSTCPHPRVLYNLVSACLAAIQRLFEEQFAEASGDKGKRKFGDESDSRIKCFAAIFHEMSMFEDWRFHLAQVLQPVPFPAEALMHELFTKEMAAVLRNVGTDPRCEVHSCVLGIRADKIGWFHLYAPGGLASVPGENEGLLFTDILKQLNSCCARRKTFLNQELDRIRAPCLLMALRGNSACQELLCSVLELNIEPDEDYQLQIISTLQSTTSGKQAYVALCERQIAIRELQKKGGPRKLTLPTKSTDADLAKLLSSGSFGNLECLSLAFTQVTSECAQYLIKLPSLKYLNLWSTQFGDQGLIQICEHLQQLQVLNLCETPLTDKGLACLASLTCLRKLNLNSTKLSMQTFELLKKELPALSEFDVRYTDAW